MILLIPSYEPDERLIELIQKMRKTCGYGIVIVDDGSGKAYSHVFLRAQELGCTIITHSQNQGKGCALKTGFRYIQEHMETEGVICADSDGQHLPEDILRIADSLQEGNDKKHILLGTRRFTGKVPFRSQLGNTLTRVLFSFTTGMKIYDTQTGLRGYPVEMLDFLIRVPGARFEYEINLLLEAPAAGYAFKEIFIQTVYHENNTSSHFRVIRDSARVYAPILRFCLSSILSALIDFVLLLLLQKYTHQLLVSVVGARICSALLNYTVNKFFVFGRSSHVQGSYTLLKYFSLAGMILGGNYACMFLLYEVMGIPLVLSKVLTETALFLASYWCQHKFVFHSGASAS